MVFLGTHFGRFVLNVSWIFERAHGRSQILIVHDVVAVEHRAGAVPGHPYHHRLADAVLPGAGDEAAPQVVEPQALELRCLERPEEASSSDLPPPSE